MVSTLQEEMMVIKQHVAIPMKYYGTNLTN